jgi:ATPase subunit of ABC transporter with duplicated ATPase domains
MFTKSLCAKHYVQVRLALALIVYPAPDLLVLDEVSTHLDMVGIIRIA